MHNMWQKFRSRASSSIGHFLVQNRPDDQYLVSYPRSGNTWMRTILVNLLVPEANSNPDIFNRRLPGVSIRRARWINTLPSPRLIKSHTWYRPDIQRAVLLVRDGRDALTSFYHYSVTRQGYTKPFAVFFQEYAQGTYGYRWDEHTVSWLETGLTQMNGNLHVVKFERFKKDTHMVMEEVVDFFQLQFTSTQIQQAIKAASLKNVRQIEQQRGVVDLSNPNASFYRGGKQEQWRDLFTPTIYEQFMLLSSKAMHLAGYDE